MKRILLLSPTPRERAQIPRIATELGLEVIFEDFDGDYFDNFLASRPDFSRPELDILALIDRTAEKYRNAGLAGVTSAVGYPGMSAASILASKLGLSGPPVEAVMICEHKYYSRIHQKRHVPEATPAFHLIDPRERSTLRGALGSPSFLKPAKSCMSRNAYWIRSAQDLKRRVRTALLPGRFVGPFNDMLRAYTSLPRDASCLVQETLLQGVQVSLEGYVFRGETIVLGIVDAIMFPGTLAFKRFQYPSGLPRSVQARMTGIATRFFSGIGYDNALFNMEFFYDRAADSVAIIEVNPKIASQFAGLFDKVDGYSTYRTLLEVAAGQRPVTRVREGGDKIAASCVLRTFEDQRVFAIPTEEEITRVERQFPGTRVQVYARPGRKLSDELQDSCSFRYGLIDLGAPDESALEHKFEACRRMLSFDFEPAGAPARKVTGAPRSAGPNPPVAA